MRGGTGSVLACRAERDTYLIQSVRSESTGEVATGRWPVPSRGQECERRDKPRVVLPPLRQSGQWGPDGMAIRSRYTNGHDRHKECLSDGPSAPTWSVLVEDEVEREGLRWHPFTVWPMIGPKDLQCTGRCIEMDCPTTGCRSFATLPGWLHYVRAPAGSDEYHLKWNLLVDICQHLIGSPISRRKIEGPTMSIVFLGILIDSIRGELREIGSIASPNN